MRKTVPAVVLAVVVVLVAAGASYYYTSQTPASDHTSRCNDPDSISSHISNLKSSGPPGRMIIFGAT